ncbi:MAG TPA: Gfo/Idh/MocA family oxidoreductase [Baekduia sp.]|nr:Gfo/Idh/MocA family oxidoreductase [Baekduia sp.]
MNERLRVGVVGCGVIAQVMHLPHLAAMEDRYEIAAVCDISPTVAQECARRFGAPRALTRWEDVMAEDLDAVLVLTPGSHAPIAVGAAESGKHVFVEKPMCLTIDEGRGMIDAAASAGVTLMVGTMKRYDPAYERLVDLLPDAGELRLVRVTTLESPFEPYVAHQRLVGASDVPADLLAELKADDDARLDAALAGTGADEETRHCYRYMLLDNLVHEFNALRGALGEPDRVSFADLSRRVVSVNLGFGDLECHLSWVDLPGMARYRQEFNFYGLERRLTLALPSPYLPNEPSELVIEAGEAGTTHSSRTSEVVSYEEAFKRELDEFYDCVTTGREPRTPGIDGLRDVALCGAVARAHLTREPVEAPTEIPAKQEVA